MHALVCAVDIATPTFDGFLVEQDRTIQGDDVVVPVQSSLIHWEHNDEASLLDIVHQGIRRDLVDVSRDDGLFIHATLILVTRCFLARITNHLDVIDGITCEDVAGTFDTTVVSTGDWNIQEHLAMDLPTIRCELRHCLTDSARRSDGLSPCFIGDTRLVITTDAMCFFPVSPFSPAFAS